MVSVRVYTQDVEWLHETKRYISLRYSPRFFESGEFEMHINQYTEGVEYFKKGNLLVFDKEGRKAGIIRYVENALDQSGKISENLIIKGPTLDGVMDQRKTVPPENASHDRRSGDAETVMKHYVHNHFVDPVDPDRKVPHFELGENKGRGEHVSWESRNRNVSDELENISKTAGLGWTVYIDVVRRVWVFDVVERLDLSEFNEAGHPPVFFSPDFNTVKYQQFVQSDNDYKNVAYVGGQGEGVDRLIIETGKAGGWDRYETFVDASDIVGEDEEGEELTEEEVRELLITRGKRKLEELESQLFLEAQILTPITRIDPTSGKIIVETPFEYEVDFNLGDIVQVYNKSWGVTMRAPITGFDEIHETDGFLLEAIFGQERPTLIKKLRKKFLELEGVDYQEAPVKYARIEAERVEREAREGLSEEERKRLEQAQENLNRAFEEAERRGIEAKDYAYEQDDYRQDEMHEYVEERDQGVEERSRDYTDEKTDGIIDEVQEYTDQEITDTRNDLLNQLADKAGLEYVDGRLQGKVDIETLDMIYDTVDDLQDSAAELLQRMFDNEGELTDHDGRITNLSHDIDMVDGSLTVAVDELSVLDGIVSGQQTQIDANAEAITFKADQSILDTVSNNVSELGAELDIQAGRIDLKAEHSSLENLEDDVTAVTGDVANLEVAYNGIIGRVDSTEVEINDLTGEVSRAQNGIAELELQADHFSVNLSRIESDVDDHSNRISNSETSIDALPGQLALKADATEVDDLDMRVSSAEVTINGLESEIGLKVQRDGVIGAINLTPESVTIDAAKLNITGDVEIENGGLIVKHLSGATGEFTGTLIGVDGTFSGDISAATGVFRGNIDTGGSVHIGDQLFIGGQDAGSEDDKGIYFNETNFLKTGIGNVLEMNFDSGISVTNGILLDDPGTFMSFRHPTGEFAGLNAIEGVDRELLMIRSDRESFQNGASIYLYTNNDTSNMAGEFILYGNGGRVIESDDGVPNFPQVWNNTSSNAANLRIGSSGRIFRSSSSYKYKKHIDDLTHNEAVKVVGGLRPVTFLDKKEGTAHTGLVAEEVAEVDSRLVDYVEEQPEGVQYDRIPLYILPIVRQHEERILELEQTVTQLELERDDKSGRSK